MMKVLRVLAVLVLASAGAFGHEYWLEPASFFLAPNEKTVVRLFVGDGLLNDVEERVYQPDKTVSFSLYSARGPVLDLRTSTPADAKPIYTFASPDTGNHLLAMERGWTHITLDAAKFEDYLREDGMEYAIAERAKLGEQDKEGRERYSRFLKSLLQVGGKNDATWNKTLGMKLEIAPLANPYAKRVGDELRFRVTFDAKPLAGRALFADNRDAETQRFTTDRNGEATIRLTKPGLWLVRLVTMRRCTAACDGADWESFWAAYTFGLK